MINCNKVPIYFLLGIHLLQLSTGLQCHTCMFVGGTLEDWRCKDVEYLERDKSTYRPCDREEDAQNWKEISLAHNSSQQTPPPTSSTFTLGCLKTIIKTDTVDVLIRGCYIQEVKLIRYGRYHNPNICESPTITFWKQLRDGPLKNTRKPFDITGAKLEACMCGEMDGCNRGGMKLKLRLTLMIGLMSGLLFVGDSL